MVAGYITNTTNIVALEGQAKVVEMTHHARHAIEQLLVMESQLQMGGSGRKSISDGRVSQEAMTILAHLKSLMWDNVGVVRTPAKLAQAVSEASAICEEADRLWREGMENGGSAGWEVAALRDASRAGLAVAESALANRVSGGTHYVVLDEEEFDTEEAGRRRKRSGGGEGKEQDSDEDEDDVLVVARA